MCRGKPDLHVQPDPRQRLQLHLTVSEIKQCTLHHYIVLLLLIFSMDSSLLSNIQKLFYERIEIFSKVEFSKLSIVTGIVKIFLKVSVCVCVTQ